MEYDEYAQVKSDLLAAKETLLRGKVSGIESKMFDELVDKFINRLEGDKALANTKDNIAKLSQIDRLWDQFVKNEILPVISTMVKGYNEIATLNTIYYTSIIGDKVSENAEIVRVKTLERFGVTEKGDKVTLTKGGFLESFVTDTGLRNEVKQMTLKAIISPTKSRQDFHKEVRTLIKGNKDLQGGFSKHFDTFAYDSFAQFDRSLNTVLSKRVGLNNVIYAGGLIEDSRPFCVVRNGKVFTDEEVAKFGTIEDTFGGYDKKPHFNGKNRDYDPFIDLGGHRCRHTLNYITDSFADRIRKR